MVDNSGFALASDFLPVDKPAYLESFASGNPTSDDYWNFGSDALEVLLGISDYNSAKSQDFAREQMGFQRQMNLENNLFNSVEAAKNRDWQEYMSNTAHQREVNDLKAAGLNPVLSATGGNGASVTSGATASSSVPSGGAKGDRDMSATSSLVNFLGNMVTNMTSLANMNTSALTNLAVADKYNATSELIADINRSAAIGSAGISAAASRHASDNAHAASVYSSNAALLGSLYHTDVGAASAKDIEKMKEDHDIYMGKFFPTSPVGAVASVANVVADLGTQAIDFIKSLSSPKSKGGMSTRSKILAASKPKG